MAPSLLQKTSNRYLQLALPENLIPSKRMGKREKYRARVAYNNHSQMEKQLCREWAFSWNTLKERIKRKESDEKKSISHFSCSFAPSGHTPSPEENLETPYSEIDFHRVKLSAPFPRVKWMPVLPLPRAGNTLVSRTDLESPGEKHSTPCSLILPHLFTGEIKCAVGGNLLQHLNHYINSFSSFPQGERSQRHPQGLLSTNVVHAGGNETDLFGGEGCGRPPGKGGENQQVSSHSVPFQGISSRWLRFFPGVSAPGTGNNPPPLPCGESGGKRRKSFPKAHHRAEIVCATNKGGYARAFGDLFVSPASYCIHSTAQGYRRADDFLTEQANLNNFRIIYSLEEKGKAAARRDKINDNYRNQLAEWRKIAFLYGNLAKKTVVRVMRQARGLRGDINSNCISLLEARLDVTLRRALFFPTVKAARQWIVRGRICVNNQRCTLSGYLLQPGDVVSVIPGAETVFRKQCLGALKKIKRRFLFAVKENRGKGERPDSIFLKATVSAAMRNKDASALPKGHQQGDWSASRGERRFPFSPVLMRKWNEWSQLWGNSSFSTGHKSQRHSWFSKGQKTGKKAFPLENFRNALVQHPSLYTSFAHYLSALKKQIERLPPVVKRAGAKRGEGEQLDFLQKPSLSHAPYPAPGAPLRGGEKGTPGHRDAEPPEGDRRETLVSQMLHAGGILPGGLAPKAHKEKQPFEKGVQPATPFSAMQKHRGGLQQSPLREIDIVASNRKHKIDAHPVVCSFSPVTKTKRFADKYQSNSLPGAVLFGTSPEKNSHCHWLHRQQCCVIDGCFPLRWNKFFARKKSASRKNHHWRWSCFKPLHLECSHKHCTLIFLYPPQKLLWPGSINMSLLWKRVASD